MIGALILLGTAGASDLNLIDFGQALIQSGIGIFVSFLEVIFWRKKRLLKTKLKDFLKAKGVGS